MQTYLLTAHCREQYILNYFGQEVAPCGKCDYCRNLRKEKIAQNELKTMLAQQIHQNSLSLDEILALNSSIHEEQIKNVLQQLILEEEVVFDGKYRLPF
jgi:superfamily II DNA helicase RecQ